ncbi:toll/interleukin-1 receptor domain-containing protein [Actinomycetospora aeridis]|uniref:Toll/interleukin-1 receptor domain-containing protein n=1 Tax=Actinomycetospora aeridis TaxID=3129231 RepID=A0ABU8MYL3_9PSEU
MTGGGQKRAFISYRRATSWHVARGLHDRLRARSCDVFLDVSGLKNGNFGVKIDEEISARENFVVVLDHSVRFTRFPSNVDWMHREIATAIERKRNIVPVLQAGVQMQDLNLPSDIAALSQHNAITLDPEWYDEAIDRLISYLVEASQPSTLVPLDQALEEARLAFSRHSGPEILAPREPSRSPEHTPYRPQAGDFIGPLKSPSVDGSRTTRTTWSATVSRRSPLAVDVTLHLSHQVLQLAIWRAPKSGKVVVYQGVDFVGEVANSNAGESINEFALRIRDGRVVRSCSLRVRSAASAVLTILEMKVDGTFLIGS